MAMTRLEMKKKVLSLIEELNPESEFLTDDPDIESKYNFVENQIAYELSRVKKIPKYAEIDVNEGDTVTFENIENSVGYEVYQLGTVSGVNYTPKADGTVLKILESGRAEINCYVYPERITDKTPLSFEYELSADVLEIMPYGIAGDLLKSDVSAEYGSIYSTRYETMMQRLDPRYQMTSIYIEGGVSI